MAQMEGEGGGIPHLAERLNTLFDTIPEQPAAAGKPAKLWNNTTAAEALSTRYGVAVTGAYLSLMRTGMRRSPRASLLTAIANLFRVPVSYFFDDADNAEIAALGAAARDSRAQAILLRSTELSDAGMASLAAILTQIRHLEGLPDDDDEPPAPS